MSELQAAVQSSVSPTSPAAAGLVAAWIWVSLGAWLWFSPRHAYPREVTAFYLLVGLSIQAWSLELTPYPDTGPVTFSASILGAITPILGAIWIRRGFDRVKARRGRRIAADGSGDGTDPTSSERQEQPDEAPQNDSQTDTRPRS